MPFPRPDDDPKAWFRSILPDDPRILVRPMFGNFAAFVNGNMFLGLFGSDIFARLSPADRAQLSGTVMLDRNQLPLHSYA